MAAENKYGKFSNIKFVDIEKANIFNQFVESSK